MAQDISAMLWQNALRGFGESYQQAPTPAALTPEDVSSKFTKGGKVGKDTSSAPTQQQGGNTTSVMGSSDLVSPTPASGGISGSYNV